MKKDKTICLIKTGQETGEIKQQPKAGPSARLPTVLHDLFWNPFWVFNSSCHALLTPFVNEDLNNKNSEYKTS